MQLWEPAYTLVKAAMPQIHTIDLNIAKVWHAFAGGGEIPYLGVAAHQEWIDAHRDLIPGLYRAYKQAADWVMANPAAAAPLVATVKDDAERQAIAALIARQFAAGAGSPAGRQDQQRDRGHLSRRHRRRPVQGHAAGLLDL